MAVHVAQRLATAYGVGLVLGAPLGLAFRWLSGRDESLTIAIVLAMLATFAILHHRHRRRMAVLGLLALTTSGCDRASQPAAYPIPPEYGRPACAPSKRDVQPHWFTPSRLQRSDIREDPGTRELTPGSPLELSIRVLERYSPGVCYPVQGVVVELWNANGAGQYTDVWAPGLQTLGQRSLRGFQMTDSHGIVRFRTITPGAITPSTPHVHVAVRTGLNGTDPFEFATIINVGPAVATLHSDVVVPRIDTSPAQRWRGHTGF